MRAERGWYQHRLQGRQKEYARQIVQSSGEEDDFSCYPAVYLSPDIISLTQLATEALRGRLIHVGAYDSWLLSRADIYQKAINHLSTTLTKSSLPDQLRQDAKQELNTIAQTLTDLWTGPIKLHTTQTSAKHATFGGYYQTTEDQTRRLSICLTLEGNYSRLVNRFVRGSCQIFISDISGRSTKGRAIAKKNDAPLRVGLRCSGPPFSPYWAISIDASKTATENGGYRTLQIVRPLSQAIQECKSSPGGFYYLQDDEYSTTYHFDDLTSQLDNPQETRLRFNEFLNHLRLVFQQTARPSVNHGTI